VVPLARADPQMYELLALVDALRLGDTRTRGLAVELLRARIHTSPAARAASATCGHTLPITLGGCS
jgi:hypothetical protein